MLTPRERVLCALNHEEPDRVPVFFGASAATSMLSPAYERFKDHLGLHAPAQHLSRALQYARLDEPVMQRFGCDGRPLLAMPAPSVHRRDISGEAFVDEWDVEWPRVPGSPYYEVARAPLHEATLDDLERYAWPDLVFSDRFATLADEVRHVRAETGCAEDLIEVGVDVLNPVQVSAADTGDTARLKRQFGTRLAFCGAIDTQWVLPHGSRADVRREVRRRLADLAPGDGYVLAAAYCIQPDVPVENVVAMLDEARLAGRYPLNCDNFT